MKDQPDPALSPTAARQRIGKGAALRRSVPAWDATIVAQRLEDCRVFLLVQGYLRHGESDRIKHKIAADFDRGM